MYIGNTPTTQLHVSALDSFSGDGTTVAFTLSRAIGTEKDLDVTVNGVPQNPNNSYTANGNVLTFTGAPSAGTDNIIVRFRAYVVTTIVPDDESVTAAMIANNSITGVKIASTTITGDKIGVAAITGNLIAAATITGDKIGLTAITGNLIAASTITGDKIASATIGSSNLTTTGVSAGNYGGATQIPVITVGTDGRISYSANVAFSAVPTFSSGPFAVANSSGAIANTTLDIYGGVAMNVVTLAVTSNTVNVALANYFVSTPAGASTWIFTGVPTSRDSSFVLQLANSGSYTSTWPASVKWPSNTAPTLTSSGVDLVIFSTVNGGTTWRGSSLIGYTA